MNHQGAVLAVDDNATARKTLELRLHSKGYRVDTAANGHEALELIEQNHYDVVLLDRKMPEFSGIDTLRELRTRHSVSELPIIMLTSTENSDAIVEALQAGANDYIIKPGELAVIDARIRAQISVKRLNDLGHAHQRELEKRVNERTRQLLHSNERLREEIRHREAIENELRVSEQRYRYLYDNNPSMYFTVDADGWIISVNRFGAQQLGHSRGELVGTSFIDTYYQDDCEAARRNFSSVLETPERLHRWEIRKLQKNGGWIWVRETARVVTDGTGATTVLVVCEDISETQLLSEKLNYETNHDPLTGLKNRRRFERLLKDLLNNVWHDKTTHALCYLDLDQFKIVNDTCGHSAGDQLIKQIAELLEQCVRRQDILARLGGDEFGILLTYCTREEALDIARQITETIEGFEFHWSGTRFKVSVSVGIVLINESNCDVENLLSVADSACFEAKDLGRNRVHLFCAEDATLERRIGEMVWVSRINHALVDDRLLLVLQPIAPISPSADNGDHYELLLRMRDDDGKIIPPGQFLPSAERYNLASKLDRWVVQTALDWLRDNPIMLERLHLCSINLSGQSLGEEALLKFIFEQLEYEQVPPEKLCFEITETGAIGNLRAAQHFIGVLKERGCSFALDDFGSGLSSFAYLKHLPVDYLKIDGLFVRDIGSNSIDRAMVKSINDIGQVMGKKTIAEFVENDEILRILADIGVDYAQGYGIGRPMPIEEFLAMRSTEAVKSNGFDSTGRLTG